MPSKTDITKLPFFQETNPATVIPIKVGKNMPLEDVNNPLIINILNEV